MAPSATLVGMSWSVYACRLLPGLPEQGVGGDGSPWHAALLLPSAAGSASAAVNTPCGACERVGISVLLFLPVRILGVFWLSAFDNVIP